MHFFVLSDDSAITLSRKPCAFLIHDNWNDWFQWHTMFRLHFVDDAGQQHRLGSVKIGHAGMLPGTVTLPTEFDVLPDSYFSLGDENYYETLNTLDDSARDAILQTLSDVARDTELFARHKNESVMQQSLMRDITEDAVRGRLHRLTQGNAKLTEFNFEYSFPPNKRSHVPTLSFRVVPDSLPPSNIHVLIGRNGVGKTRCLQNMTSALVLTGNDPDEVGTFTTIPAPPSIFKTHQIPAFANVISVTFSAFDPFGPFKGTAANPLALSYSYIGLKGRPESPSDDSDATGSSGTPRPKTMYELMEEFVKSVLECRVGVRNKRWREALETLESDPLFKDADVAQLADIASDNQARARARVIYEKLSSGHKIVLLTLTRLVETVSEKTVVLIDEPEAHLHPPLLAAFVRSLSALLVHRNGIAIIATHSPVVLQEAPKSCVWILRRSGAEVYADRPRLETFGENVGILTNEVFGLEVTQSGFHKILDRAVEASFGNYELTLSRFDGHLGAEARSIVRGLIAARKQSK